MENTSQADTVSQTYVGVFIEYNSDIVIRFNVLVNMCRACVRECEQLLVVMPSCLNDVSVKIENQES